MKLETSAKSLQTTQNYPFTIQTSQVERDWKRWLSNYIRFGKKFVPSVLSSSVVPTRQHRSGC
ncbi:hypothetical protein [Chroococcidiopsis sp. CCMEE 29]|uniref:hypothetical protein n=1 Tax=Chroococcidiopsis sp. CCMEE 29 TaxID=155894 RepID=UPI00201FF110|nr:hypothetical protein [Chroococcidiopsis sp. CCMEE 29]